jgi:hypothetical protein
MTLYYFDTSALVKYYVTEPGSTWVRQLIDAQEPENGQPLHAILLADITRASSLAVMAPCSLPLGLRDWQPIIPLIIFHPRTFLEVRSIASTKNADLRSCKHSLPIGCQIRSPGVDLPIDIHIRLRLYHHLHHEPWQRSMPTRQRCP